MSWKPCRMHFFTFSQCFWMMLTLQNLKLGGNLEFSWYSCNILRYCSNRCIVWFSIPEIVRPKLTESFPFNYMLNSKFSLSRHFEYANKQITYHFWLWLHGDRSHEVFNENKLPYICSMYDTGVKVLSMKINYLAPFKHKHKHQKVAHEN
jgi:hypothetical protein